MESCYEKEIECLCLEIDAFVRREFHYRTPCARRLLGTITVHTKKADLYFRYKLINNELWDLNTLVIARMGFHDRRRVHITRLLELLSGLSRKCLFNKIGIEWADEFLEFMALGYGFQRLQDHHWIVGIADLNQKLADMKRRESVG